MDNLEELFEEQVKDLHSAENQLIQALPKMAKKATNKTLKAGFESHLKQTQKHAARLEEVANELDFKPSGKKCKAMEGLIEEGNDVIGKKGKEEVIDLALIAAAQRVEHYEIAAYSSLIVIAEQLGLTRAVEVLNETLDEEKQADEELTRVCSMEILESLPSEFTDSEKSEEAGSEEDESETDEEDADGAKDPSSIRNSH